MKKNYKKIGVMLFILAASIFIPKVGATAAIEYQTYNNGVSTIKYNKDYHFICNSEDLNCETYVISGDEGVNDDTIVLTNSTELTDTFELPKSSIANGYILYTDGSFKLELPHYGEGDGYPTEAQGVSKLRFLSYEEDPVQLIKNAEQNTTFMLNNWKNNSLSYGDKLEIPHGVRVVIPFIDGNYLVNDGTLVTGDLSISIIRGTGNIELDYNVFFGDGPENGTPLLDAERIFKCDIDGVKVDITNTTIKNGTSFGSMGDTTIFTEESAKEFIEVLNKIKGSSMDGYKVVLKTYELEGNTYYYGALEKLQNSSQEIKNPNTGDNLYIFLGLFSVSALGFGLILKRKIRN